MIDAFAIGFGLELASPEQVWQPDAPTRLFGQLLAESRSGSERVERSFELAQVGDLAGDRLQVIGRERVNFTAGIITVVYKREKAANFLDRKTELTTPQNKSQP